MLRIETAIWCDNNPWIGDSGDSHSYTCPNQLDMDEGEVEFVTRWPAAILRRFSDRAHSLGWRKDQKNHDLCPRCAKQRGLA